MNTDDLKHILEQHKLWLEGNGGSRANLIDANLRGANLRDANLRGANLRGANLIDADPVDANLCGANLRGTNLRGANLIDADLTNANLRGANLRGANLCGANLRGTNLRDANLRGADLSNVASLWGATGNHREVKAMQVDIWPVTYTATRMQIGCQLHSLEEWWGFTDDEIARMDERALEWWKVWKPILQAIVSASPAVGGSQ